MDSSDDISAPAVYHGTAGRPEAAGSLSVLARRSAWRGLAWFLAVTLLLICAVVVLRSMVLAGTPVTVVVDGFRENVRSTRPDVASVLSDLGLVLRAEDRVQPALDRPLAPGMAITVDRARRSLITADGTLWEVYSHAGTVESLVAAAGLKLSPYDEVYLDGRQVARDAPLPAPVVDAAPVRYARGRAWESYNPKPLRLSVHRAVRIMVDDGSVPYPIFTTADTIGEALLREQVTLYLGDQVQPSLGSQTQAGMRVHILRSKPVLVTADGRTLRTRSRGRSVGDALAELGIMVTGNDRVTPSMSDALVDNMAIRVVRVQETVLVERETIPYEAILQGDDQLEIDQQQMVQAGADGEFRRRYKLVFEDGQEISRTLTDAWVAAQPVTQVVAYGQKIVMRSLDTGSGTFTYWRKVRMLATAYSKSTAGVPRTSPDFGWTRTGLPMAKGIVAVDPSIIALGSQVYVAGYGVGLAADTGGAIRSRHLDLGYDDDNLVAWYRWVEVYLLGPPPSPAYIRWVLPNWPPER